MQWLYNLKKKNHNINFIEEPFGCAYRRTDEMSAMNRHSAHETKKQGRTTDAGKKGITEKDN